MNSVIRALRNEEKKSLKLIEEAQKKLNAVRRAMKVLGGNPVRKAKRRSAATRARMSRGQKKRWAEVRAEKKAGG